LVIASQAVFCRVREYRGQSPLNISGLLLSFISLQKGVPMPRKPRFIVPGVPVHIVQRGRSREPVFYDDADYRVYLGRLKEAAEKYQCQIHAYVLMTNHIHLLATPSDIQGITRMMQYIGRHYVPYINHTYGGSGSIWEGNIGVKAL
jgi:REP element-mobilizing transposase RayT